MDVRDLAERVEHLRARVEARQDVVLAICVALREAGTDVSGIRDWVLQFRDDRLRESRHPSWIAELDRFAEELTGVTGVAPRVPPPE